MIRELNRKFLRTIIKRIFFPILFTFLLLDSCTKDHYDGSGYPEEISNIITTRCAVKGCHQTESKEEVEGFDMSTWERMFEGGEHGSNVIPYRPDQSPLMYFVNTDSGFLGLPSLEPRMPYNAQSLSQDEVTTLYNWIKSGAADKNGNVAFCCDPFRKKFYVCNAGTDLVTVFYTKTRLPMRVIDVGSLPSIERPHNIKVSPDGKYWYINFLNSDVYQKFETGDDAFVSQANIGSGGAWNTQTITSDSKFAFVTDLNGHVACVDLQNMSLKASYDLTFLLGQHNPHGSAVSSDSKTLYITIQTGNFIIKYDFTNDSNFTGCCWTQVVLDAQGTPFNYAHAFDPHQVAISPDGTKYFVTCQYSNEVRVMNVANDSLLAVIPVGNVPQELDFSHGYPYLFVSCMDDTVSFPGERGSVAVINYQTNSLIKSIFTGWQPHGLHVDDMANVVYVANRNVNLSGPAPHHSVGGKRNGYVTVIDMSTLDLIPDYSVEVSADPYEVTVRE